MKRLIVKFKLSIAAFLALSVAAYAQGSGGQAYASYAKEAFLELIRSLKGLSTSTKIGVLAVLAFLAVAAYLRSRNTASNNMRRAREHHRKAIELHEKGKAEEAAEHYRKAAEFREKSEALQ